MFMLENYLPEQVSDINKFLINTTPVQTPFSTFVMTKEQKANDAKFSWIEETINETSAVTQSEGGNAPAHVNDGSALLDNYAEIFAGTALVSNTAQAVSAIGVNDLLAKDVFKKTQSIKLRMEDKFINGTKSYDPATKTYHTGGILEQINTANRVTNATLNENSFLDTLEKLYTAKTNSNMVCFLPARMKMTINGFSDVKYLARDKVLGFDAETYTSVFGNVTFVLAEKLNNNLFILNSDYIEAKTLIPFHIDDEPVSGSKKSKYLEIQTGIALLNSKAAASFAIA